MGELAVRAMLLRHQEGAGGCLFSSRCFHPLKPILFTEREPSESRKMPVWTVLEAGCRQCASESHVHGRKALGSGASPRRPTAAHHVSTHRI